MLNPDLALKPSPQFDWDIFCTVIDHYGDAGISWRLARQLAQEYGQPVRLWIDDLAVLARLVPTIDQQKESQVQQGVIVQHWQPAAYTVSTGENYYPARRVVEAFGCRLPQSFLQQIAQQSPPPLWLNLEYLSTEPWAGEYHGACSPHPTLPLRQWFFFPGFCKNTGGVLAEKNLLQQRLDFQDRGDAHLFWAKWSPLFGGHPVADAPSGGLRISLFSYSNPALLEIATAWANGNAPIYCFVSDPKTVSAIAPYFGKTQGQPGEVWQDRRLHLFILPFLSQVDYDHLLWSCDLNFVRGEDSFVRGQWAGVPFVWQAYPQEEEIRWQKVAAFLAIYSQESGLAGRSQQALTAMHQFWNLGHLQGWQNHHPNPAALWQDFRLALPELQRTQAAWCHYLQRLGDLAQNLSGFCASRV